MKKIREMGEHFALDGRRLMGGHNNQPKVGVNSGGGHWRGDATRAECVGGCCLFILGGKLSHEKIKNKRGRAQALGGLQSIKKRNNQPKDRVYGGGGV
jgi:hypothetical protein